MMETRSASLAALREELAISSESVSDASLSQAMERALQAMVPSGQPLQGLQQQDVARLVLHRNLLGPPRAARADIVLNITHAIAMLFGFVRFCWTVPALCLQLPFWLMALGLLPMCAVPLWVILHRPHFHARHRASMMSGLRFVRNVYITFTMAHMARPCTFSAFGAIFLLALLPGTVTENMAEGNLLVRHLVGDVFGVLTLVVANQNWGLSRTCCQNLPKTGILGLFAPVVGSSWGSAVPCQQQVVAVQLLTAIVGPSLFAWRRERTMRQQFLRERRAKAAAKGKARAPAFVVLPPARRFGALSLRQRYAPAGHRSTTP
ncbi:hypothetical protein WJX72_005976 [[Myrmecia] bisecta]|uniref:Uncharacterized protein n=1 Tax=[Myrmecia] bisecta TaxID=41462 RepID=A0AAW1PGH6_9CHLO